MILLSLHFVFVGLLTGFMQVIAHEINHNGAWTCGRNNNLTSWADH